MQVSALVGCEATVFAGCCSEPAGVCLGVHGLEVFFQEPVVARGRGDQGFESRRRRRHLLFARRGFERTGFPC